MCSRRATVLGTALVLSALVLGTAGCGDDGDAAEGALDEAIATARADLPIEMTDEQISAVVQALCAAADAGDAELAFDAVRGIPAVNPPQAVTALGRLRLGAATRCPTRADDLPELVDEIYERIGAELAPGSDPGANQLNPPMSATPG